MRVADIDKVQHKKPTKISTEIKISLLLVASVSLIIFLSVSVINHKQRHFQYKKLLIRSYFEF